MVAESKKARREADGEDRHILNDFGDHLLEQRAPLDRVDFAFGLTQERVVFLVAITAFIEPAITRIRLAGILFISR